LSDKTLNSCTFLLS